MSGTTSEGTGGVFSASSNAAFKQQLNKVYAWYTGGFMIFVVALAILEQMGLPRNWIGYLFLAATVLLYAGIGVMSRTNDAAEYYVKAMALTEDPRVKEAILRQITRTNE